MTTDLAPVADTVGADCGAPVLAHLACPACYPSDYPGMVALCGAELLGITPPLDRDACQPCEDIWIANCLEEHPHP